MKKVLCLVLVLLCLPVWSSAAALTPEEVTQTLNNIINDSTVDNMEQLFVYVEDDNAIVLGLVSEDMMNQAVAAIDAGKDTKVWHTCKALATKYYQTCRSLIDTLGREDLGFRVYFMTSLDGEGSMYYGIGDKADGNCIVFVDVVTGDETIVEPEE